MATDLLLITPGFPAGEWDTTCVPPMQEYLLALRRSRPHLRIAAIATQYPYDDRSYRWNDIEVHACNGRNKWYRKPRTWSLAHKAFAKILEGGPVNAVHSFWLGECSMLGARFAKSGAARHITTLMGQDARDGARWWKRLREEPVTVCLSTRHAENFRAMTGRSPDAIIPWGIPRERAIAPSPPEIDLLWCGSFLGVKAPDRFIALLNELRVRRRVNALMIGRGGKAFEETRYKDIADMLRSKELLILDEQPRDAVLRHMARARILVHTSTFESQGYVFDEALANGMCIVSHAVGTAQESERWRIASDAVSMGHAVIDLLERPASRVPSIPRPVEATANEYLRLYGIL